MCPPSPLNSNFIIRDPNNIEIDAGVDENGNIYNLLVKPDPNSQPISGGVLKTFPVEDIDCATVSNPLTNLKTIEFTLVEVGDIDGISYVAGTEGQIKTIKEYLTGSTIGDYAKITIYEYGFTNKVCQPSKIIETNGTV